MLDRNLYSSTEPDELETICFCFYKNRQQIVSAILDNGLKTVEEVGKQIKAGTNCGRCQNRIQAIIDDLKSKNKI